MFTDHIHLRGAGAISKLMDFGTTTDDSTAVADPVGPQKFGCVYTLLPPDIASDVMSIGQFIDDDDINHDEGGCEDEPHVTLLYGLHESVSDLDVQRSLRGVGNLWIQLGDLSVFEKDGCDVLVILVKTDSSLGSPADVVVANQRLARLDHTNKYDYLPHVTVAYLKKGTGKKYTDLNWLDRSSFWSSSVVYSEADKTKHYLDLVGPKFVWCKTKSVADRDYKRDDHGRFAVDGGGSFGGSGSKGNSSPPGSPPSLPWKEPPKPTGKGSAKGFGYTSDGITNTEFGDIAELASRKLGLESLLPPTKDGSGNRRQNPLDVRLSGTRYAFEIKAVSSNASEYKIKMKAKEVKSKIDYAKKNNLKPGVMIMVMNIKKGSADAYWRSGIGSYRLTKSPDWHYMGSVKLPKVSK